MEEGGGMEVYRACGADGKSHRWGTRKADCLPGINGRVAACGNEADGDALGENVIAIKSTAAPVTAE